MSVNQIVTPAKAGVPGQEGAGTHVAHNLAEIPASAGMTGRLRRAGMVAGGLVGGLLALDLIGFLATVYFSAELMQAAQAAGVAGLLPR
jgi:hypothetical protein